MIDFNTTIVDLTAREKTFDEEIEDKLDSTSLAFLKNLMRLMCINNIR